MVLVFEISLQLVPPLTDDCHFKIMPVWPLNVNDVLFVPGHTAAPPETVPPTLDGTTETVVATEYSVQTPLVTTALKYVVADKASEV